MRKKKVKFDHFSQLQEELQRKIENEKFIKSVNEETDTEKLINENNVNVERLVKRQVIGKSLVSKRIKIPGDILILLNQTLILRAILKNDMLEIEDPEDFIQNLIIEEWKRLFSEYEKIKKDI